MNTVILFYGFIVGIQTSIASQVGQQIGRQDIDKARAYLSVGKTIARIQILITAASFYLLRGWIVDNFTDSKEVKELWHSVSIFVAMNFIPDHWQ